MSLVAAHWRKLLVGVAVVASFAAGRGFTPPVEVREVERVVFKDRWHEAKETKAAEVRVVYRKTVTKPDGTKTEESAETTAKKTDTKTDTTRTSEGTRVAERTVVVPLKAWQVGLLVGAEVQVAPLAACLVVGLHGQGRIAQSPFFVGVFVLGNTGRAAFTAGGSLSGSF